MRKAIRMSRDDHEKWQDLLPYIWGNVGFIFTKGDLNLLVAKLSEFRVPAAAKVGMIAPQDVFLTSQVTTLEPTKTPFFAALDIGSKITRGCVEILADVKLCTEGKKVGSSEAALLQMLNMRPFTYGLKIVAYYDENYWGLIRIHRIPEKKDVEDALFAGIRNVAALSLAVGYPTLPAFPYAVGSGIRNVLAIGLATSYQFKQSEELQAELAERIARSRNLHYNPYAVCGYCPEPKNWRPEVVTSDEPEEFIDIFG